MLHWKLIRKVYRETYNQRMVHLTFETDSNQYFDVQQYRSDTAEKESDSKSFENKFNEL